MALFKAKTDNDQAGREFKAKLAALDAQMQELQTMPERLKREEEDRARMLPPSDLLEHRREEKMHDARVSRGEIKNTRREVTRSLFLSLLLICSVVALLCWAYTFAKSRGLF